MFIKAGRGVALATAHARVTGIIIIMSFAPSLRAKGGMAGSSSSSSLPVDDIAKAVSGAVSSILSKFRGCGFV